MPWNGFPAGAMKQKKELCMKIGKFVLICILACFVPFMVTAQPERESSSSPEPHNDMMGNAGDASYAGTWECTVDEKSTVILVLKEQGGTVAGVFKPAEEGDADIGEGEIRGEAYMNFGKKILEGTWTNKAGESGWMYFDITDDGSEFYGSWGYGEERIEGHSWNGKRVKE